MSGKVITILRKQTFDYTFLGASASETVTLHKALPVRPYYYYWLGLRVHNINIQTGNFVLGLPNTLPYSQDPQEFTQTGTPTLQLTVSSAATAPSLLIDSGSNLGPYLKIILTATQGTAGNRLYAEFSAVLFGRVP